MRGPVRGAALRWPAPVPVFGDEAVARQCSPAAQWSIEATLSLPPSCHASPAQGPLLVARGVNGGRHRGLLPAPPPVLNSDKEAAARPPPAAVTSVATPRPRARPRGVCKTFLAPSRNCSTGRRACTCDQEEAALL